MSDVTFKIRAAEPSLAAQDVLSESEHTRLAGMHEGARPAFVTARAMLRAELGSYMGLTAKAVPLCQVDVGRITIEGFDPNDPPYFSVSHTGAAEAGISAVAVSEDTPIGIDIQQIDHAINWQRVAERRFPEAEWALISAMPEAEGRALFFTLWAIKEAFVKMEDGKLMPYLRGVEIDFSDGQFRLAAPTPAGLVSAGIFFTFIPEFELAVACVTRDPVNVALDSAIRHTSGTANSLHNLPSD
ncbi:4'-phosphopantetheinyl transferase family protein [Kordiimonas aquimaris]|uniref:4'-phosphopantetheinyl transferase family protein n=1 Tax=Kordiimonas aquimaris TaxID=707591 RepID=UPI0021CFE9AD|nr:4'-phosphopantetheinyl transferase superfamily protein [Kordiimonas aquimaris]